MLEEQVVSFKVAKLAWGKGFRDTTGKWRGKSYYNYKGELNGDVIDQLKPANRNNPKFDSAAAPTQSLLQTWLRDTHNLRVYVVPNWDKAYYNCYILGKNVSFNKEHYDLGFKTYEEALEAGLLEGLNLIKE